MVGLISTLCSSLPALASHIVGGNLVLAPKGGGLYTVCVVLYYDANSSDPNAEQNELTVSFFRKKDHVRLDDLSLKRISKAPLAFSNPGCAQARNLKLNVVKFAADIRLDPARYNDAGGYYLSWERCCRSGDVGNLQRAGTSSLVLYAEFPPVSVGNSSPVFRPANGEILCLNTPYQFESGASDSDGDELRYRLETPFNSTRPPYGIDPLAPSTAGPYPKSEWASGFSSANAVPGNPALQLDSRTGSLRITPTKTGLFVYRVVVEEYRNDRKIGEVHRDYQLLVMDCSSENPPPVALTEALYPPGTSIVQSDTLIEVGICQGDTLALRAEQDSRWRYQWQRNGSNLDNATGPAITITQEGVYTVVKTFADRCANSRVLGEKFEVKYRLPDQVQITPGPKASMCEGTPLDLSLNVDGAGWTFQWKKDGTLLNGSTQISLTGVREAGLYTVHATNNATGCVATDTVSVSLGARPEARIITPAASLCEGDSLLLRANEGPHFVYTWFRNSTPLSPTGPSNRVREAGLYVVEVRDTVSGCERRSEALQIAVNPVPGVLFDSIPPLCGQGGARLSLSATPAGGVFSGKGIEGTIFDARVAGLGNHSVTYTYSTPSGCSSVRTRTVQVVAAPRVQLGLRKAILQGDSILLRSSVTAGASYQWSPPEGLSSTTVAEPIASPVETTTYRLRVSTASGCYSENEVTVDVFPALKIPNGFTPNGDGANDLWTLENGEAYPDCEVSVFNRWGNRVFHSVGLGKEWDGKLDNQDLPAATYYYVIKPHPSLPVRSGSISLFR